MNASGAAVALRGALFDRRPRRADEGELRGDKESVEQDQDDDDEQRYGHAHR